jgi:hypothetical protein
MPQHPPVPDSASRAHPKPTQVKALLTTSKLPPIISEAAASLDFDTAKRLSPISSASVGGDQAPKKQRRRHRVKSKDKAATQQERRRRKELAKARRTTDPTFMPIRESVYKKYAMDFGTTSSGWSPNEAKVVRTGFTGFRRHEIVDEVPRDLDYFLAAGFEHLRWDGRYVLQLSAKLFFSYYTSKPVVLVDDQKRIFAVLAGRPDVKEWDGVINDMADKMLCHSSLLKMDPVRGDFGAVFSGVSFGGGQKV